MHKLCKASFFDRAEDRGGARMEGEGTEEEGEEGGKVEKEKWPRVSSLFPRRGSLTLRPSDDGFFGFFLRRAARRGKKLQVRRKTISPAFERKSRVSG